MNNKYLPEYGTYHPIYNRGMMDRIFSSIMKKLYFFLNRYDQYLSAFCDTIVWVLLRNHFHLRIYVSMYGAIRGVHMNHNIP